MAIVIDDDFTGVTNDTIITGRALNNAAGGTVSGTWDVAGTIALVGDGTTQVDAGGNQNARSSVNLSGQSPAKARFRFNPDGGTSNIILFAKRTVTGTSSGNAVSALLVSHTSLRIREAIAQNITSGTDRATLTVTAPGTTFWLEIEFDGLDCFARILNNDLSVRNEVSYTFASLPTGDNWGCGFAGGGAIGKIDDFIVEDAGGGDVTAPILTSAVGTATGATTATGSVTTDEAGPAWAVLTGSSTTPSEAQIKAGQSHTGAAAAASDTATLVVGANADVFDFAGLTGSTAYWLHVVQDDTATPTANTSAPITSASSFTTDAPSDTTNPTMNGSITVGTKTANSISISYSAASDNVGVTGYEVSSNGGGSWSDNGTSLSYTFLGLAALTAYDLAVRAYDAAGNRATPITVNTSTYRSGGTVQDVYDNTAAVGGNPQGVLYDAAAALVGTEPNSWLSYYTVSGPTPSGGTLDASPLGDFEYFGPDAAIWTIQPERNGVDYGDPVVVELYDQTPELSSPTGIATGATTATGTVVTDRGTGTLFFLASTNATEDETAVAAGSSQAVSAVGTQNVSVSSLTGATAYYLHYMHRSPSGYDSAVVSSGPFTTDAPPDETAPSLTSPTIDSFSHNSVTATVISNEAGGSLFFVATENASELDAVVQAGSSQAVTMAGLQVVNLSGLTPETTYYVHMQQIDPASNESAVVTAGPFTTSAAPVPGNGGTMIMVRRRRRK